MYRENGRDCYRYPESPYWGAGYPGKGEPVSYTHLDVYKRQRENNPGAGSQERCRTGRAYKGMERA